MGRGPNAASGAQSEWRRAARKTARGIAASSRNWRTASRKCPAKSRSRSRFTSLTEGLAQILSSEREKVEVLVPGPRPHLVQELLIADHERPPLERVIAEGERRLVQCPHVHRLLEAEVESDRQIERVSVRVTAGTRDVSNQIATSMSRYAAPARNEPCR